ncbi:MAG: 4Fe-4S dicluster domain-containing protein [Proteobacteria bacterium]|nr:4Fe-4S dicluster domain-containing protein [Desulfobulbaceae bacterium]MBU4152863.1 4Fe-4S dicluster domain-containing protein [Pseudomonadota bacterium]MDP2104439.1 4Fe-4S dicluster domain-containing protein [Desulfobulbaceae bacterium]
MNANRRKFLKNALTVGVASSLPLSAFKLLNPDEVRASIGDDNVRWAFLVDIQKCVGCGFCVKACKLENEIPYDAPITRTWVERYVVTKDGKSHIDTPMGGRDGYTSARIHDQDIPPEEITKAFFVPKLCNQCQNPACVQVCPVGATYQTNDGVVLIDRSWCIGCGYCIMACPYGVRFFHPVTKTAEKCTFCYHRINQGLQSACVQACPFGARQLGNLKDHDDPVTKTIMTQRVSILKDEYGTKPQVYYIGLDERVR